MLVVYCIFCQPMFVLPLLLHSIICNYCVIYVFTMPVAVIASWYEDLKVRSRSADKVSNKPLLYQGFCVTAVATEVNRSQIVYLLLQNFFYSPIVETRKLRTSLSVHESYCPSLSVHESYCPSLSVHESYCPLLFRRSTLQLRHLTSTLHCSPKKSVVLSALV